MKWLVFSLLQLNAALAYASSIPTNLEFAVQNSTTPGAMFRMADHPNGVFVFEAFTVACGSCGENTPAVNRLAAEYKNNPRVHVIDLGQESVEAYYREWVRRFKPNHLVVSDVESRVYNALRTINQTPQVFVVSCTGLMMGNFVGTWSSSDASGQTGNDMVRELVEKALKTTCTDSE